MVNVEQLAENYAKAFPGRPGLLASHGWLTGTWAIGACYKNPNKLYGAYPYGYLKRVHAMFPEAKNILHVFSGGLTKEAAMEEATSARRGPVTSYELGSGGAISMWPIYSDIERMELVDLHGESHGRHPTWQGDLFDMPEEWHEQFDLILADPPYSVDDAKKYEVQMVNRGKVTKHLRKFCRLGGSMVWLDVCWPQHRKVEWKTYGHIGLVRSTNHRMRLVSFFEAV